MLSHKTQAAQLKEDIKRCSVSLKQSAESFNGVIASIEQVLSVLINICDVTILNGPQTKAETIRDLQRLLNVKEIAAYLGVADRSIYLWIKTKGFPCRRVGDDLRFDLNEIEEWTRPEEKRLEKARLRMVK